MCGYPTERLTTTADVTRVYGRIPTKVEIIANRQCHDYIFRKRREGTLITIPQSGTPVNGTTISVWAPDQRSITELWAEARISFPNAATTLASQFDNPEIDPAILS